MKGHCEFLENWHVSCSLSHGTGLVNILGGKQQHLTEDNTNSLSCAKLVLTLNITCFFSNTDFIFPDEVWSVPFSSFLTSKIPSFLLTVMCPSLISCGYDKIPWREVVWGRECLFRITNYSLSSKKARPNTQGMNLEAVPKERLEGRNAAQLLALCCLHSYISYIAQAHLPQHGFICSGLCPP